MSDFDGASGDVMSLEECATEIGRLVDENKRQAEWIAEAKRVLWAHEKSDHTLPYELQNLRDALLEGDMGIPTSEGVGNE